MALRGWFHRARWKAWLGVSLLVVSALGVGWIYAQARHSRDLADPARARQQGRPIPVRTSLVTEMGAAQVIGGTAATVASETALLQVAPMRARAQDPVSDVVIKAVHVRDGDYVKRGQLLFDVDELVLQQILSQREVELSTATALLRARQEDLAHQQQLLVMARKMHAEGLTSQAQLLEAESRVLTVQSGLDEANARVNLLRSDITVARRDRGRSRITSPLEGFISEVVVVPGTVITQPTVLAKVLRLNPLHVMMDFPQEHLRSVYVGQQADTVLDSFPQESFPGTVVRIMPEVKRDLRVLPVLIEIPNPQQRLKAGISGFTRLRTGNRSALGVPTTALVEQDGRAMVFRVEDGRARLRDVRIGSVIENGWREVIDGLSAGDEVVIFTNFYRDAGRLTLQNSYLQDNDRVNVDWRTWTRRE